MHHSSWLRAAHLAIPMLLVVAVAAGIAWAQDGEERPAVDAAAVLTTAAEVLGSEEFGFECAINDAGVLVAQGDGNALAVALDGDVLCVEVAVPLPEGADAARLLGMCNELNQRAKLARYTVDEDGFIMAEFATLVVEQLDPARFAAEAMAFLVEFSQIGEG